MKKIMSAMSLMNLPEVMVLKYLFYILLLPMLLCSVAAFADIESESQGRQSIPQYDDTTIEVSESEAGSNGIIVLGNTLGRYENGQLTDGNARYSVGMTVIQDDVETSYDLTETLAQVTDFSSQRQLPLGTTLNSGDKVYFYDEATKRPYYAKLVTRQENASPSDFNAVYGRDSYYQFSFSDLEYDGVLDIVLAVGDFAPAPVGQPLPGVLTTLCIGSAVVVFAARRRKKKVQMMN